MQLLELLLGNSCRRFGHQVERVCRLWERDNFAQAGRASQQHHNSIKTERNAAVRRRAVLKRIKEEAEAGLGFLFTHPERSKYLLLHILAMDTNGARAKLKAVHRQVIDVGAAARRLAE